MPKKHLGSVLYIHLRSVLSTGIYSLSGTFVFHYFLTVGKLYVLLVAINISVCVFLIQVLNWHYGLRPNFPIS